MRAAPLRPPTGHLFVCTNHRDADAPLGPGCGDAGEAVYAEAKRHVAASGLVASVWVTRTLCLGICPRRGAAAAVYPRALLLTEVEPPDVPVAVAYAAAGAGGGAP